MAWPPAQKDVGITPLDWNFFFYLYTLAFASAFLCLSTRKADCPLAFPWVAARITAIPSKARLSPKDDS